MKLIFQLFFAVEFFITSFFFLKEILIFFLEDIFLSYSKDFLFDF